MCKAALTHMVPRRAGVIVNLARDSGIHGEPGAAVYSAAKAGVVMMTRVLAIDHDSDGIRLCSVYPAIFDTPMLANAVAAAPRTVRPRVRRKYRVTFESGSHARGAAYRSILRMCFASVSAISLCRGTGWLTLVNGL